MFIGIYEKAINNKFSWEEKIDIAKKAGFDFIEFSVDESQERLDRLNWSDQKINDLKKILVEKNFYFNSMALSGLRKFPYGSHEEQTRKKALEITEKAIILAKKLGIRNIQLAGYDVYYEESDEQTRQFFIEGVKKAVQIASKYSVMLSFETMDHPFMGTISKALEIVNLVDNPWLNIYPDMGNLWQFAQKNNEEEWTKGINKILGIHFKDTKPNIFKNVEWGQGTVDFKKVMKILSNLNYKGPFLVEMWSQNESNETIEQNVEKLKLALKFFNKQKEGLNGF